MSNWGEEYKYAVFKYNVFDANYYMLPVSELPRAGFSSLYLVTKHDSEAIEKAGFAAYRGTVWSPRLWIDTDTEQGALETERRLQLSGLDYEVYTTGNRGMHFSIDRPHEPSHLLPRIDKEWVAANIPNCDLSIYTHLNMFRNVGAVHEKTGNRKKLLRKVEGRPLILPDTIEQVSSLREDSYDYPVRSLFADQYLMTLTVPLSNGERHAKLLNMGMYIKKLGEPIIFIDRWLHHANLLSAEPIGDDELSNIISFIERAE